MNSNCFAIFLFRYLFVFNCNGASIKIFSEQLYPLHFSLGQAFLLIAYTNPPTGFLPKQNKNKMGFNRFISPDR